MTGISPATKWALAVIQKMLENGAEHPVKKAKEIGVDAEHLPAAIHMWVVIKTAGVASHAIMTIAAAGHALEACVAAAAPNDSRDELARREKAMANEMPVIDEMFRALLADVDEDHIAEWLLANAPQPEANGRPTPPAGFDPAVN